MKYLNLTILTFFLLTTTLSFSQNQDIARAYYIKAKEAFANEQYQTVIEYLGDAKKELGSTNPDIIYLELISKYNINRKDPQVASLALEFINSADRGDDRIQKVSLLVVEHKKLIDDEIKRENGLYDQAVTTGKLPDLRKYIEAYPNNGERSRKVEELINQSDNQLFAQVKTKNTVKDLENYKKEYPRGQHLVEVEKLLQVAREEELYIRAKKDEDIYLFQSYIIQYPNGKYVAEITNNLDNAMITKANTDFEGKKYGIAKVSYENYVKQFPSSEQTEFAESQLKKIRKIEEKKIRENKRTSKAYTMFSYTTDQEFGLEFGKLHLNKVSTYFGLSANKSVIDMKFSTDEQAEFIREDFEEATLSANFGLTYKIVYPLWVYAGGGIKYTEYFIKETEVTSYEILDVSPFQFFPEAGVQAKIDNALVLKAGAIFLNDGIIFKTGIGF